MNQEWKVYYVWETKDATGEICGGDDELQDVKSNERSAVALGKRLSMKKTARGNKVHCVWISYIDEEEDLHTTIFISKGKVTHKTTG